MFKGTQAPEYSLLHNIMQRPNPSLSSAVRVPMHNAWGGNPGKQLVDPTWVYCPSWPFSRCTKSTVDPRRQCFHLAVPVSLPLCTCPLSHGAN